MLSERASEITLSGFSGQVDSTDSTDKLPQIEKYAGQEAAGNSGEDARVDSMPPGLNPRHYLQVVSAFFVFMNTWGLLLAFGAFQTFYEQNLLSNRSSSDIAWISTICGFIVLFIGLGTGPLFDYGFFKPLLVFGSLLQVFGLMMLSLSTQYYQVFLAQGICVGIGGGLLYVPSIAAAATSFDDKTRPKVIGIIASGTGIGGVIYPIIFRRLISSVGFPWTVRTIGFIVLATYVISWSVVPFKREKSGHVRRSLDLSALLEPGFGLAVLAAFFSGIAYYIPLIYLPLFAETGIPGFNDPDLAFYLLAIVNATSVVGRLATGMVAARVGPLESFLGAYICGAVVLFGWIGVHTTAGVIVWAVFWGLASSATVALPGAIIPLLSPSMAVVGTRTGMYWAGVAVGVLIGGPIAGALVDVKGSDPSWWHIQVFTGLLMIASAVVFVVPVMLARRKRQAADGNGR